MRVHDTVLQDSTCPNSIAFARNQHLILVPVFIVSFLKNHTSDAFLYFYLSPSKVLTTARNKLIPMIFQCSAPLLTSVSSLASSSWGPSFPTFALEPNSFHFCICIYEVQKLVISQGKCHDFSFLFLGGIIRFT